MGLDFAAFPRYVENLPKVDKRIKQVVREQWPGMPEGTIAYRIELQIPVGRVFNLVYISGTPDKIAIYQPLKRFPVDAIPLAAVDELGDWWAAQGMHSLFQIALSPDGVLLLAAEGEASKFAAHETRRWISGVVSATHQVLHQVLLRFPD